MNFGVLGPVTVTGVDGPVDIGGPRQRRLMAALLANANTVVSTDRLIDIVFESDPPAAAATTIRTYVARLRRSLADGGGPGSPRSATGSVVTQAPGYKLSVDVDDLDAARFEATIETGRRLLADNEPVAAVAMLRRGLGMWRGEAYGEFAYEDWARAEALRLDELRVVAAEELNEALLACGLTQDVVFETKRLIQDHPLRDRLRAQLALALFRSGRQAESLRSLDDYRSALAEVGLEQGGELVSLERAIVVHDPALRLESPAGRPLRGYRVGGEVGEGRHGVVYRAVQPGVGREVAIKTIRAQLADHPDFIRRFDAEAQLVAHLEHPHIVPIYDYWREPGGAYIVMRLLSGSVEDRLAEGPMECSAVAAIARQLGGALTTAHRSGVIHGDIKPSNVLIDEDNVYLADFGVATLSDDPIADRSHPSSGYESPEILTGQPPGKAADQFALAVLLTQLLTGTLPFGKRAIATEHDRAPSLHVQRPSVPAAVDRIVWRATSWRAEDRHPDVASFIAAFVTALEGQESAGPDPVDSIATNPYRGLEPFSEADGPLFFGRGDVVDEMVERLGRPAPAGCFLAVVGASGSGKSSVVRAGLLPRLRAGAVDGSDRWFVATMTPGAAPFRELEAALLSIAPAGPVHDDRPGTLGTGDDDRVRSILDRTVGTDRTVLLVIDQLEELFTLVRDEAVQDDFLAGLARAVDDRAGRLRVVTTLRADLYDRPLRTHVFGRLLSEGTLPLLAMSAAQLEETVTQPAARVGVDVEPAMLAQLVADVIDRPAALPLLQFTLSELFERSRTGVLTLRQYRELGGVGAALAARAEDVHAGLTEAATPLARALFLRLVTIDDVDTVGSNRCRREDLRSMARSPAAMDEIIDAFGSARLLVFDRDRDSRAQTVEIAHEALIAHWPRLADWIAEAGEAIRVQAQVAQAARLWEDQGRQSGDLYRGIRLEGASEWAAANPDAVRPVEREFLEAGHRLLESERERERVVNRRLRRLLVGVGVALVLAVVAASLAVGQSRLAGREAAAAGRAQGAALAAASLGAVDDDRSLALLLAVESSMLDDSPRTHRALLSALVGPGDLSRTVIPTGADDYTALAVGPDRTVAAARRTDGSIDVIDLRARSVRFAALPGPARPFGSLSIDPTGTWLTSAGLVSDGTAAIVYQLDSGDEVARIAPGLGAIHWSGFGPDGTLLLADDRGGITIYRTGSWQELRHFETGFVAAFPELLVSPDGSRIYAVDWARAEDQPADLYALDARSGELLAGPQPMRDDAVVALALSDDGTLYAAEDHLARYDAETLEPGDPIETPPSVFFFEVAALPDGRVLAGGPELLMVSFAEDGESLVQRIDGATIGVEPLAGSESFLTVQPSGAVIAWTEGPIDDLGVPLEPVGPGVVTLSPDGSVLTVWGSGRGVQLFDRGSLAHRGELAMGAETSILGVDFSRDGRQLAVMTCPFGQEPSCEASLTVWDVAATRPVAGPVDVGPVASFLSTSVAFADADRSVVTAGDDGMAVWDADGLGRLGGPRRPSELSPVASDRVVVVSATETDGSSLVSATSDSGQTVVWAWQDSDLEVLDVVEAVPAMFLDDGTLMSGMGNGPFVARDADSLEPTGPIYRAEGGPNQYHQAGSSMLVSSAGHGGVELWDRTTGDARSGPLPFSSAAVDPEAETMYLGAAGVPGLGREVRVLSLRMDDLAEEACRRAGRNLTGSEWRSLMTADQPYRVTCPQWPDASNLG